MEYDGQFYAQLSLAVLLSAVEPKHMILTVGQTGTESLSIDSLKIPLEHKGSLLIPFHGPHGTYRHISASDILKGITETGEIEGHIVIIGAVAPGLLDIHATPIDPTMAGVEVHANIIDTILQGDFLVRPKAAVVYEFIAIVFFGLLSTILFARCRAIANLICLFLFALGAVILTAFLFRKGIYLSPLYPCTGLYFKLFLIIVSRFLV